MTLSFDFDWDINWSAISAVAASSALCVTAFTFWKNSSIAATQVYMKIADKIDKEKTHNILKACKCGLKEITEDDILLFDDDTQISGSDLRIFLLLPLSDLAIFWQMKLISTNTIHHGFRMLIAKVGNSRTILEYIRERRRSDYLAYKDLEALYIAIYNKQPFHVRAKLRANFDLV